MDERERRKMMRETFDTVSPGYDNPALRFFVESARHLAGYLEGLGSGRVLDAATGTGNVAMEIARRYPGLHVTGIDLSPGMLAQARAKAAMIRVEARSAAIARADPRKNVNAERTMRP